MVQTTPKIRSFTAQKTVFFFSRKSKLKYAYSMKLSCSYIYFPSFWSFKTTPDFVITFKNSAFKG